MPLVKWEDLGNYHFDGLGEGENDHTTCQLSCRNIQGEERERKESRSRGNELILRSGA